MDKSPLPPPTIDIRRRRQRRLKHLLPATVALACFLTILYGYAFGQGISFWQAYTLSRLTPEAQAAVARCASINAQAGPSANFHKRTESDRYQPGSRPVLIQNAKVWTGDKNGTEVVQADLLLEKGIIKGVGTTARIMKMTKAFKDDDLITIDAKGAWVTPGIVDMHSHLGDSSSPMTEGASEDDNSSKGPILPWLRALDGLNTHDDSYALSIAGGVTTALVLPGSANAIGGQAYVIKLRKTLERSPTSMLLEPPYQINGSLPKNPGPPRWRHMKHACGENPDRVYGNTRMDTVWAFREAYNKARELKTAQDNYCAAVQSGNFDQVAQTPFPEDLQWEALVDVLRGHVKVNAHCYEAVDLDDLVRLSNEFQFPLAAVHHAHEAYLVPEVLKSAYGGAPAVAMFATNARYKREAYRGSEFAPRILAANGLRVVMKSDHPVLDSRYLLFEAQQAYFYGLPENLALASVTSTSADIMGLGHRIGYVKEGWDADLVIWDSHPLALGATPTQVIIDGIPQLWKSYAVHKPHNFQETPQVPNYDKEMKRVIEYEGLPPLAPRRAKSDVVLFTNVKSVFNRDAEDVQEVFSLQEGKEPGVVVVVNGTIRCSGSEAQCLTSSFASDYAEIVDLKGGSISPGFTTFGSPLGLEEIEAEASTNDGTVYDPLTAKIPNIVNGPNSLTRAVDGLQFGGRSALLAYHSGVTRGIVAPRGRRFWSGVSTLFSTGALNKLEDGAVLQEEVGVHVAVRHWGGTPSVSTQIGVLRRLLKDSKEGYFKHVREGKATLVVEADSADIIATIILLKKEIEEAAGHKIHITIVGGIEAHLVAEELAGADIGVIQNPSRPFPTTWERRRIMAGHPLTEESSIEVLLRNGVKVGIGIEEAWSARNTALDIAWLAINANGNIPRSKAFALASTNVEQLLGVKSKGSRENDFELVATEGGDLLEFGSKVTAIISPRKASVDLL